MLKTIDTYEKVESGWNLFSILFLKLEINVFTPLRVGSSDIHSIPKWLHVKKSLIDIKLLKMMSHKMCFKWAILAVNDHECTTNDLRQYTDIDFSMMEFPVDVYCDTYLKNSLFR